MKLLYRLWHDEEGQDVTEYALLLVLVALAAISVLPGLSTAIKAAFTNATSALTSATNP